MSTSEFFFGHPDRMQQVATRNPEQINVLNQLLQQIGGMGSSGGNYNQAQNYYGNLLSGDQSTYDRWAAPYMQQFEQETIPRLAERFAGLGGGLGGGAMGSSGFAQALGGAGAGLQSQLAGLFENLKQSAAGASTGQYNNLLNQGLNTQTFENVYQPGNTGFIGQLGQGLAQGVGSAAGMGIGAGVGAGINGLLGSYLNKNKPAAANRMDWGRLAGALNPGGIY